MVTALFDGYCVICQSTRKTITILDWFNRVEFLDLHDADTVMSRYPDMDYEQLMGQMHVVEPDGSLYAGYYATRRMLKEVPLGFPVWLILQIPGMDWMGTRVYKFVARNRYQINKLLGNEIPDCVDGVCKIPQ
jgi:predicted DCC family thiol-disulfide oxidoreductase YuxK